MIRHSAAPIDANKTLTSTRSKVGKKIPEDCLHCILKTSLNERVRIPAVGAIKVAQFLIKIVRNVNLTKTLS